IKVLYVEDEKILRSIYTKILSDRINKLYVGENGEEGYNLYEKHKPDLIITDIKMPVMSGLEMVRKIKAKDQNIKIVIMSAYGQTEYFMQAIKYGVQGFLLKPVDNKQLFSLINELAEATILEKRVKYQEVKRRKVEKALKRSEAILKAVNFASEQFLKINYEKETIKKVLQRLGEASEVSRVYIFKNNIYNNRITTSQKFEWVAKNIKPEIDNPELQDFPILDGGFERWVDEFSKGNPIYGLVKDFPESEQEILSSQYILSIVVVPIFVDKLGWGFIGFDDCKTQRIWTSSELKALNTAADIFGAAIHRGEVVEKLKKLNAELEKRVEERTEDLQEEISEHICTEIKLRESEENYRQIFENANDGILLTVNGIINFIN
ncbi:MAG: response regulator, partial [Bacteroidales bacterium]|nr:response regulator [Bacteroidales bacterium]